MQFPGIAMRTAPGLLALLCLGASVLLCTPDPVAPSPNTPPRFYFPPGSDPTRAGVRDSIRLGTLYTDTLHALDPDGDSLRFSLLTGPRDAHMHDSIIVWSPREEYLGTVLFTARVDDGRGGSDTLSWNVTVGDTNHPPIFFHPTPGYQVNLVVGTLWHDTLVARDCNNDPLTFQLRDSLPPIEQNGPALAWTPHEQDTGIWELHIQVRDPHGGKDTLTFTISVSDTNQWPAFARKGLALHDTIHVGEHYQRTTTAFDRDNDSLRFTLLFSPQGMTNTGPQIDWLALESDTGQHLVTMSVHDPFGAGDTLEWSITVFDTNHPPRFLCQPGIQDTSIAVGSAYRDTALAQDRENDELFFSLISDSSPLTLTDSIVSWTPRQEHIGTHFIVLQVTDWSGRGDTLSWTVSVADTNYPPSFLSTADSLTDTLFAGDVYRRTLRAADPDDDTLHMILISAPETAAFEADSLIWIPAPADAGDAVFAAVVTDPYGQSDTLSWQVTVRGQPQECPPYTRLYDAFESTPSSLPPGYYLFTVRDRYGLFASSLHQWNPTLIPGTQSAQVTFPAICDNGTWITYLDRRTSELVVIRTDGSGKTTVPLTGAGFSYPRSSGFLRNSPYGDELWYSTGPRELRAIKVLLLPDTVLFGADRVLADLTGAEPRWNLVNDPMVGVSIAQDQILARFENWVSGERCSRTEFLTVPNRGMGVGTEHDIYHWKNDDYRSVDGCGHALSHDGTLALVNPSYVLVDVTSCVPVNHFGVAITPFRRSGDPALNFYHEHFLTEGISINWVPVAYREGADFWAWQFSNDNQYIIGRQYYPGNATNGAWVLAWESNTWIRLHPPSVTVDVVEVALYFGSHPFQEDGSSLPDTNGTDTSGTDPFDPRYRVISPNGGEVFFIGEPCTIRVTSVLDGDADVILTLDDGEHRYRLPGLTSAINPRVDSLIVFFIPDSLGRFEFDPATGGSVMRYRSSESSSCRIELRDYQRPHDYKDTSDGSFAIRRREQ